MAPHQRPSFFITKCSLCVFCCGFRGRDSSVLLRLITHLGLQFDKLFGDLVRRTLAEDSQNRPPGLVHVHPTTEREPTSTRTLQMRYLILKEKEELLFDYLVHDVFKLHDRDSNELIVATEAVIFHPDVQFIRGHLLLVANNTGGKGKWWSRGQEEKQEEEWKNKVDLQVEGLVELWRPISGLLFGLELPLLIRKMRTCSGGQPLYQNI